jgi:hypothetical protein
MRKQPVPVVTSDDVDSIVRREFPGQFARVMELLRESGIEKWERETFRVHLAAVKLADGSAEKLRFQIELAKQDFRDVLAAAEYPSYVRVGFGVRELPVEEQRRIIEADLKQYES